MRDDEEITSMRQRIALMEVTALFDQVPLLLAARLRYLPRFDSADAIAAWVVQSLVRAGAAKRDGADLVNSDL